MLETLTLELSSTWTDDYYYLLRLLKSFLDFCALEHCEKEGIEIKDDSMLPPAKALYVMHYKH